MFVNVPSFRLPINVTEASSNIASLVKLMNMLMTMSVLGYNFTLFFFREKHCNKITKNGNKPFRLLHHTLSPYSKEVKSRAYQTLVRPQLEYATEAWKPYVTTADRLEHIQHVPVRFVQHDYRRTTSINNLNIIVWDRLHTRRLFLNSHCLMNYTTT